MRYTATLISLVPSLLFPLVAGDCWSESGPQADQKKALAILYQVTTLMSGQFRRGQTKFACIDDYSASTHYYLTVKNLQGDEQLTADYIFNNLRKEMAGCRRGGHSVNGNYEFNVDTLPGICIDGNWLNSHPETIPGLPRH